MKKNKGFTLIELLVTVAIIGLLSAVVLVSLNSARRSANDARRKADLKQIANAMEMKYDGDGSYPSYAADDCSTTSVAAGHPTCASTWTNNMTTWMSTLPRDPKNDATYYYRIKGNSADLQKYCVTASSFQGETTKGFYVAHNGSGTPTIPATTCPDW